MGLMPSSGDYRYNPLDRWLGLPDPLGEISKKPNYDRPLDAASQQYMQMIADYNKKYNQAFQEQNRQLAGLRAVVNGTAPSVAQMQLQQGVGQIAQQQHAQASGATGANATIARIAAMNNTGAAQAQANQAAAVQRAMEIDQARRTAAAISAAQTGDAVHGAVGFAGPTASMTVADQAGKAKEFEDNRNFWSNIMQSAGRAIVGGGAGAAAGGGGTTSTTGDGGSPYGSYNGYMGYGQSG